MPRRHEKRLAKRSLSSTRPMEGERFASRLGLWIKPAPAYLSSRLCAFRPACSILLLFLLVQGSFAAVRTWDGTGGDNNASTPANWVGDTAPVADDNIVLDSTTNRNMTWDLNIRIASWTQIGYDGTATIATVYGTAGFTNLNITGDFVVSNGVLSQVANPNVNYESNCLSLFVGGSFAVGPDGLIDLSGKGYAPGRGPGIPSEGGGCYGGVGSKDTGATVGLCYGSVIAPTNLGSGGVGNTPRAGGGALRLTVAGQARVDGTIQADGVHLVNRPGAGGSVFITAGTFTGSGAVTVIGGCGYQGGGGGRIAVVVTDPGADFSGYSGSFAAYGGTIGGSASRGGAGTIYLEKETDSSGQGELIVDNAGSVPRYVDLCADLNGIEAVTYEFDRIILTNCGVLAIGSDDQLIVSNTAFWGEATSVWDGILINGGALSTPGTFVFSNFFVQINSTGCVFDPTTSLTIGTNACFLVDQPLVMTSDLHINPGGVLTHSSNTTTEASRMILTINGNLAVRQGGVVDVTGRGYKAGQGPGCSPAGNTGGASYGGRASRNSALSGPCYGSIIAPTNIGSGGGRSAGGGAVILNVTGTITNDGGIIADGGLFGNYTGSGGSIYLTAGAIVGSGTIRANGGEWTDNRYPGGGGRVSLIVTNIGADFAGYGGSIEAFSGRKGVNASYAGAGTVYLVTAAQDLNSGTLIIDNDNLSNTYRTEINTNVHDAVVGDMFLRNAAHFLVETNQAFSLSGVWSNAATFEAYPGSMIMFGGGVTSTSIVYGSNTFMGLVCTNFGKTILFEAGRTNTVADQGVFWMKGAGTTNLYLRSTVNGQSWMLNVGGSADQSVMNVDVKDSDAMEGVGAEIIAINSRDSGSNTNWDFVSMSIGETNVWSGNISTVWSLSDNWSLGRPPVDTDFILIPTSRPRYPVLDAARTVNGIEIQSNAMLSLNNYDLTVTSNAMVAGAIGASGMETVEFRANVDFTGGTVTSSMSTVEIAGNVPQAVNLGNLSFYSINMLNSADTVIFNNGFSCYEFRCEAPAGNRSMEFQQGETVTVQSLLLLGSTATTNIMLRSTSAGQKWLLELTGYQDIIGVDVQDSDASPGQTATPASSCNSGGNVNWDFGTVWANWQGTNSVYFDDAANWSPPTVPGSGSRVMVENGNPMMITSAVSLLDLTVGGTSGSASVTADAGVTIGEDIIVLTNATLTLNRPCVISNRFHVMGGGTVTHSSNTTAEINKLELTVQGDVQVDLNGVIDVSGKGYAPTYGPGCPPVEGCGSYGGLGTLEAGAYGPCYGSIVAPTNIGSGGRGNTPRAGGGAVLMTIVGECRVDGKILADGVHLSNRPGSGGSVFITAGSMRGSGEISAKGGDGYLRGGGGGRIALVVTNNGADFSEFTGTAKALSGEDVNAHNSGAGTVYWQIGNQPNGWVCVDNDSIANTLYTDVPPAMCYPSGEVDRVAFYIRDGAILRLTNDFTIGDLFLPSADAILDLNTNNLNVNTFEHDITPGVVTNFGAVIWYPDAAGTLFLGW